MRKTFVAPAAVRTWIVVDFAASEMQVLSRFVHELHQAMVEKGQYRESFLLYQF